MKCRKNTEYNSVFSLLTQKHNPMNIKAVTIRKNSLVCKDTILHMFYKGDNSGILSFALI